MKEIRLHGIGGLGTVKAGEMLVHATVASGKYGNSTPMFGFERQGAPVTSFVRLSNEKIRAKNQVYNPDCTLILDPSLLISAPVFEGMKEDSVAVLNTQVSDAQSLITSPNIKRVAWLDATTIALEATGWVDKVELEKVVLKFFGEKNVETFRRGYNDVKLFDFS